MKTKAFTLMRNDTENKKSRADPFDMTGWQGFCFYRAQEYKSLINHFCITKKDFDLVICNEL